MRKEWLLQFARKKILREFDSPEYLNAAKTFEVTPQVLSNVLGGRTKNVPDFLLDYMGYEPDELQYRKKTNV